MQGGSCQHKSGSGGLTTSGGLGCRRVAVGPPLCCQCRHAQFHFKRIFTSLPLPSPPSPQAEDLGVSVRDAATRVFSNASGERPLPSAACLHALDWGAS